MRTKELEVITGNSFRELYDQMERICEVLSASEILKRGIASPELRGASFYPADGLAYFTDKGRPCLGHEKMWGPVVFALTTLNLSQLERLGHYRGFADHKEIKDDSGSEYQLIYGIIDLSQLRLSSEGFGNPFLRVPLAGYDGFNPEERKLTERIYGTERVFHRIMKPLGQEGITETRIILPDPQEVLDTTKNGPFWKIGYLNGFYGNFQFDAANSELKRRGNLLGKRKKVLIK